MKNTQQPRKPPIKLKKPKTNQMLPLPKLTPNSRNLKMLKLKPSKLKKMQKKPSPKMNVLPVLQKIAISARPL